jgi:hypothetical protein
MTAATPPVLTMGQWPRGFCPAHYPEPQFCNRWCLPVRWKLAQLQADYWDYWAAVGLIRSTP